MTALPADDPASDGGMPRNVESPTRNRPHRGRRPGNPDTRSHIAHVASRLFLRDGFHRTSLRAVAREAEVDPALVHHYFSSKENLFFASMEIGIDPDKVFKHATELGTSALGRRLASLIVRIWESSTRSSTPLVPSSSTEASSNGRWGALSTSSSPDVRLPN